MSDSKSDRRDRLATDDVAKRCSSRMVATLTANFGCCGGRHEGFIFMTFGLSLVRCNIHWFVVLN
jgi:hypothetical protein